MTAPTRYLSLAIVVAVTFAANATAEVKLEPTGLTSSNSFQDAGFIRINANVVAVPVAVQLPVKATVTKPKPATGFKLDDPSIVLSSNPAGVRGTFANGSGGQDSNLSVPPHLQNTPLTLSVTATYVVKTDPGNQATARPDLTEISNQLSVMIDNRAPVIELSVEKFPGGEGIVHLHLEDTDVDENSINVATAFDVVHNAMQDPNTSVTIPVDLNGPVQYDRRTQTISLAFANLNPGTHTLTITGLKDRFGHVMKNDEDTRKNIFTTKFTVPGGQLQGAQVEFPRFLRPNGDSSGFNPADRVDTRVVDLYYFRDAARVAQVINRNVRDLDRAGYDVAQQFAKRARDDSRTQIDERRHLESLAVQDAQRTRQSERELETKQQELQAALQQQDQMTVRKNQMNAVIDGMGIKDVRTADDVDNKIKMLTSKIVEDETSLEHLTDKSFLRTAATDGKTDSLALVAAANSVRKAEGAVRANNKKNDDILAERRAQRVVDQANLDVVARRRAVATAETNNVPPTTATTQALAQANRALAAAETALASAVATLTAAKNQTAASTLAARNAEEDAAVASERAAPLVNEEQTRLANQIRSNRTERSALQTLKAQMDLSVEEEKRNTELVKTLQGELAALPGKIVEQRENEITSRNRVAGAERKELRLEQERFRREVAAGVYDRDTYVAGKVTSRDPVTQVSITVLGPARLQLRGPIQGINKIRRMIHQIDSPVGQVKVGIHTIQINGEHGDRMDKVYEDINKEISHSRFLVNSSSRLFQKAVVRVATAVGNAVDDGHIPKGFPESLLRTGTTSEAHQWRYIYTFFGGDFINELRRMNSELLQHENKLLSLHSMDSLSFAGALYVTSLARGEVREMILRCFQDMLQNELPDSEYKYLQNLNQVHLKFGKLYRPSMNTQAKMDQKLCQEVHARAARLYTFPNTINFFSNQFNGDDTLNPAQHATIRLAQVLKAQLVAEREYKNTVLERSLLETQEGETEQQLQAAWDYHDEKQKNLRQAVASESGKVLQRVQAMFEGARGGPLRLMRALRESGSESEQTFVTEITNAVIEHQDKDAIAEFPNAMMPDFVAALKRVLPRSETIVQDGELTLYIYAKFATAPRKRQWVNAAYSLREAKLRLAEAQAEAALAKVDYDYNRKLLLSKRLLEQFMDEQEEKSVELLEALRSHASNVDNYLKRLAIAVEDDVNAQFYEPAFQRVRHASRSWDVNLGQVETTTILTNNRTLAKVSPSATMEFDLPMRDILLTEAMKGSKALATEYGNLMQDGTFLAGSAMLAGTPAAGIAGGISPVQAIPGVRAGERQEFGSALQKLIPDPEVYKFETGTGFEIRPVIQPDGHSIVYTFDYTYTTNVREPVRADEKHLGRVKRHFVHTDVQTSSYELREVSRYMVSLKASRTARGVPLMEDIPILGAAFRPLPSAESSLQQNVILASSVIYPTMFDLMGLRWSQYADDVHSDRLVEEKQKQLSRQQELRQHLIDTTRSRVNSAIGIHNPVSTPELVIPPGTVIR